MSTTKVFGKSAVDSLTETLEWMESRLGVSWQEADNTIPDPPIVSCLNGRLDMALALEDHGEEEKADQLLTEILDAKIHWEKASPDARLALARTKKEYAHSLGRRAVGKDALPLSQEKRHELAAQAFVIVFPFFDELITELEREKRALELWGKGYSVAAWAQRGHDRKKVLKLLARIVEEAKAHPEIGSIRDAAAFAVDSLLSTPPTVDPEEPPGSATEENSQDGNRLHPEEAFLEDPENLWREAKEIFGAPYPSRDDSKWLVGAVGALCEIAQYLKKPEILDAIELPLELQRRWNDACYQDSNVPWAISHLLLRIFTLAVENRQDRLSDPLQALLVRLAEQESGASRKELARFLYNNPQPIGLIDLPNRQQIQRGLVAGLERLKSSDSEILEMTLGAIHVLCDGLGEEAVREAWGAAASSPSRGQEIWLQIFIGKTLTRRSGDLLHHHADGAFSFLEKTRPTLSHFGRNTWTNALLSIAAAAQCNDDLPLLKSLCNRLWGSSGPRLDWLQAVILAATGLGRRAPETIRHWTSSLLSLETPPTHQDDGLEIFCQALTTLVIETAKTSPEHAAELVDRLAVEVERAHERNVEQMSKEQLRELNARLATSLYNQWAHDDAKKDADETLAIFDKLLAIESRAESSALAQLHFMAPQVDASVPREHPRREEIDRHLQELSMRLATVPQVAAPTTEASLLKHRDTDAEAEVSEEQLHLFHTDAELPWAFDPICPGDWLLASESDDDLLRAIVADGLVEEVETIEGCRLFQPGFYPGVTLAEVQVRTADEAHLATFALGEKHIGRFDGTSPLIHNLNAAIPIALDEDNALDYLRFFCLAVQGQEGPFRIASRLEEIPGHAELEEGEQKSVEELVHPPEIVETKDDGSRVVSAVVKYSNALFNATFSIAPGGMIEMLDDDPAAQEIAFVNEGFRKRLRFQEPAAARD